MEEIILKELIKDRSLDTCNYFVIWADKSNLEPLAKKIAEAINITPCCTELKTVKQGENLILDNKFDVEVITPESSVLIKHKEKDTLMWVDKQRLKRN